MGSIKSTISGCVAATTCDLSHLFLLSHRDYFHKRLFARGRIVLQQASNHGGTWSVFVCNFVLWNFVAFSFFAFYLWNIKDGFSWNSQRRFDVPFSQRNLTRFLELSDKERGKPIYSFQSADEDATDQKG